MITSPPSFVLGASLMLFITTAAVALQVESVSHSKRALYKNDKLWLNRTTGIPNEGELKDLRNPNNPTLKRLHPGHHKQSVTHTVNHKQFLNEYNFWILMAAMIFGISIAVAMVEREFTSNEAVQEKPVDEKPVDENQSGTPPLQRVTESQRGETEGIFGEYWLRLLFCFIVLNLSMILWGIAQEYVTTNVYMTPDGDFDFWPSSLFLVFSNRTCTFIFCTIILKFTGKPLDLLSFTACGLPAISNGLASWSQYASLNYVSFTLQTTAKSAKLLPVLLFSTIRGKSHTIYDYTEAVVITCGLVVFGFETDPSDDNKHAFVGILLLCAFLFCDSLTPHLQDALFLKDANVDVLSVTQSMGFYGSIFALGILLLDGGFMTSMRFLAKHPQAALHILILAYASCITQYMISYTIKHFGPVAFTVIASTRQLISVSISTVMFEHHISTSGVLALIIVVGTLLVRTVRMNSGNVQIFPQGAQEYYAGYHKLFVCACGIHVLYGAYGVLQEFLTTHHFIGEIFEFPLFLIAANHTLAAVFALILLKSQGKPVCIPKFHYTTLPAVVNVVSTYLQHQALYTVFFPVQTLMKSLKVIPVMLVGGILKNRTYNEVDYAEAVLITILVTFFVWDFQIRGSDSNEEVQMGVLGILLMVGYVITDSFTPNLEDAVYQLLHIDPGQMLFGIELISGLLAWIALATTGQLFGAMHFFCARPEAIIYVGLLAVCSAAGAYNCTLTVRLFGPAVFTLIMVSRQVMSLIVSVIVFQHSIRLVSMVCLSLVIVLILASSFRQVHKQIHTERMAEDSHR